MKLFRIFVRVVNSVWNFAKKIALRFPKIGLTPMDFRYQFLSMKRNALVAGHADGCVQNVQLMFIDILKISIFHRTLEKT